MSVCGDLSRIERMLLDEHRVCLECVKIGAQWVHLRTCQTCGGTHCCDSSPHRHATAHWRASRHPVVISAEPGERWLWCYDHEQAMEY